MERNEKEMYEKTKYPKIFKKSYWGRHLYGGQYDDDIIENRNMFVTNCQIKEYKTYIPNDFINLFRIRHFDHVEYYVMENKDIIILTSVAEGANLDNYFQKLGFKKYKKLYSPCSTTYFGIIPYNWKNKLSDIRKIIKKYLKENYINNNEYSFVNNPLIEGLTQEQYILSNLFI